MNVPSRMNEVSQVEWLSLFLVRDDTNVIVQDSVNMRACLVLPWVFWFGLHLAKTFTITYKTDQVNLC